MDFILNRYRNITVLLVVIVGQLLLLAYQVKTSKDVPLIRVWAVSTVTPVEAALEFVRRNTIGVVEDYFVLIHVKEQNDALQRENGRLKIENNYLKNELSTADRLKQLAAFQEQTPSKTMPARIIGTSTGANSKAVFVDRGSVAGIEKGMAVITPDGIVGKIVAAYPTASLVMLITDPSFAAGVVSQKNHIHGTLKGDGGPKPRVDFVQNEETVDKGEWFYTSGDDRIFPRGFPVGQVASVSNGHSTKDIYVTPSGLQDGLEEVLIVTEGVHQPIPEPQLASAPVKILPPPDNAASTGAAAQAPPALSTDADRLKRQYQQVGEDQKVTFGAGFKVPDFSKLGKPAAPQTAAAPKPPAVKPKPAPEPADADTADADLAGDALPEKVQPAPAKPKAQKPGVIYSDKTTEILAPVPPPVQKKKSIEP